MSNDKFLFMAKRRVNKLREKFREIFMRDFLINFVITKMTFKN